MSFTMTQQCITQNVSTELAISQLLFSTDQATPLHIRASNQLLYAAALLRLLKDIA